MYVKCSIFKNNIAFRTLRSQTFQWEKKETPSSQNRDPNNQLVKFKLAVLEIQMSPSSPASWGALQGSVKSARPEHIEKCQQRRRSSVIGQAAYFGFDCIRTLPRGGMYWEIHPPRPERFPKGGDFAPRGPRDCPRAKPEGRGVQNPRPREISRAEGGVFSNAS